MNPDNKSNSESKVEAMTANDLLSKEAYTFAMKRIKLATFEIVIAVLSLLAKFFISSCNE